MKNVNENVGNTSVENNQEVIYDTQAEAINDNNKTTETPECLGVAPIQTVEETPVKETTIVTTAQKSYLETIAEKRIEEIQKLNPGFRLDFMNVFTRLKLNSKGQFYYELSGEEIKLTDNINTKLLAGEPIYQYWGEKDTEDEGNLICYSKDKVVNFEGCKCSECPYDPNKCKIRFAMALHLLEEGEDEEEIFNINLPSTGAYAFADYVKLMSKKYKKGVADVITTMVTEEKTGKEDSTIKYNAVLFKYSTKNK